MHVDVDEDKANLAGVTNATIAQTLNAYFSGHHLTTFREGDHLVPAYLRLTPEERGSLGGLDTAFVEGVHGKVPLDSVASIIPRWEPSTIERRDLNRVIEIRAEVEPGVRGNDVVKSIMASEEMKQLQSEMPSGYWVEVGGMLEESNESASQLGVALAISLLTIVLLLVIQYNGWAKPIVILTTLPLALIGALPGLWITGNPLGLMPQLGILALFGIVLNTGIIFIEFADTLIKDTSERLNGSGPIHGLTRDQFRNCLVEAGKQRLLPIFLTTATTIGGLLPLALGGGPLWEGMSWCMIFGLLVATLLTLLVVPALYAIMIEHFGVRVFREA
jgi:multidrug efflux pump subunit AcrB